MPHGHVVAVKGDVDGAECHFDPGEFGNQPAQALCQRDTACMNANKSELLELGVSLDDLVRDPHEGAPERIAI